ncbi:uncharacterized protein LAESUDRAFT_696166 [Laetiporus sulphureus 93-53]|uniref:Uncharacterized protein n=1 Tax=Laetiporus sulphureus 93-53 TaxID=1314785 RepID=A0A165FTN7_9APHY|nr:uncharacterized protein LAESUDRAFT_696166 [Laetiporus sulphureus 93-53]KZT09397.1 hypothetical protein LAESUDRAFT_696166 [Laetiporus sulphureus 93-53]
MLLFTISIAIIAVSSGFSALRVYAVSGHRLAPALITLTLGMVFVGVRVYYYIVTSCAHVEHASGHSYCAWNIHVSNPVQFKLTITERICGIAADLLVLTVTWYRTYHVAKNAHRAALQTPIVVLFLRDGTLYFITLLILNVLGIVLVGGVYGNEGDWNVTSVLLAPFSSILVSRFILNLREASCDDAAGLDYGTRDGATSTQNAVFASRLVGNIGTDLQYDASSSDVMNNEESADVGDENDENVMLEVGSIVSD